MFGNIRSLAIAAVVGSLVGGAHAQDSSQNAAMQAVNIHTGREYNGLCKRARTAEEFQALSNWCGDRSSFCSRRAREFEAELNEYYAHSSRIGLKYPPRDQELKQLIYKYQSQAAHWSHLGDGYKKHVAELRGAETLSSRKEATVLQNRR